jgi:hypothetical protein
MIKRQQIIDNKGKVVSDGAKKFRIWDDEKGYLFQSKDYFVKQFLDIKLSEYIKDKNDYANLHILAENIFRDTNMIAVKSRNVARPANVYDISSLIGICERRTREFLDRTMQKGLIAKTIVNTEERIETQYYLSPLFFMSNKYLGPFLFMMFRQQLKPYLKEWAWKALSEAANLKDVDIKHETVKSPMLEKANKILNN